jgi:DNA (cytosine-5)-methyltransferase 1
MGDRKRTTSKETRPTVVDIYCGAGGTSYGAAQAGLDVRYGLDRNKPAVETFVHNHPGAVGDTRDVAQVTAREILEKSGVDQVDYLLSGPNCQAVSTMGLFYDADPRNLLFTHLARLIDEFAAAGASPRTVVIENVPGIAFQRNVKVIQDLVRFFLDRRYRCAADVVNFATWGLPQLRHRFVLVATLEDYEPSLPAPVADLESGAGLVTAWEAIGDLSDVQPALLGERRKYCTARNAMTPYQHAMRGASQVVLNHHIGRTAPIDLARMATVPPGGSWKDIPTDLMPERFRKVRMTDYKTLYGRILEDHPAYTISASFANVTSGCFTHPRHNRPISVREGCRLQGFPDSFEVLGPIPAQYRQIGNAVPAYAAKTLIEHLEALRVGEHPTSAAMRLDKTLLFRAGPVNLPVLTPRYQRIGYGSGTYWPKGWGTDPGKRLTSATDYRISTEPIRFRRTDWRRNRDRSLLAAVDDIEKIDWSSIVASWGPLGERMIVIDGVAPSEEVGTSAGIAQRNFLAFLGPATGLVSALATKHKCLLVRADFGLTSDWLFQLTSHFTKRRRPSVRIHDGSGKIAGPKSAKSTLWITAGEWPRGLAEDDVTGIVMISPFADQVRTQGTQILNLLSPTPAVRIRMMEATTKRASNATLARVE